MKEKRMFMRSTDTVLPKDPLELTDIHLQSLKPRDTQYDRLIGEGLILRVRPTGKISFRFNYRLDGRQRVTTVGRYPKESLKVLRSKYLEMSTKVEGGEDVAEVKMKKKRARRSAAVDARAAKARRRKVLRIEGLADLFIKHIENPRSINKRGRSYSQKTVKEYRSHLLNHVVPEFGAVPVDEIQRKDIASWLKKKAVKAPSQSNHLMSTMSALFSWATDEELIAANLIAGMKKPGGRQQSKTRALDYNPEIQEVIDKGEIKAFWNGLDTVNPLHRMALRLILMTALRPGEVLGAKWVHILEDRWVVPVSATKNKKDAHKVPLTSDLKKMLKELREVTGGTVYLFPQSRHEDGKLRLVKNGKTGNYAPVETSTVAKVLKSDLDIESFTAHDLRRTAATHLKSLGFLDAEIGMLLHHISGDVTAIYARGDDMNRKLKMLNAWHRKMKQVLSGEARNVVSLR